MVLARCVWLSIVWYLAQCCQNVDGLSRRYVLQKVHDSISFAHVYFWFNKCSPDVYA